MKELHRFELEGAVDGDGHILEPPDMWARYIDPAHRDVAMAIRPPTSRTRTTRRTTCRRRSG